MSKPTISDVHVNRPLTNIAVAYIQSTTDFIADKVFPIVPVAKQSDRYFVYTIDDWFRDEAQERAPSTESAGGGWSIDNTPTYYCRIYAFHKDIDDDIRANADEPIDLDRDATTFVTQKLLIKRETIWATNYFRPGVWGTTKVGGVDFAKWSDYTNSTPIEDIGQGIIDIARRTGFKPNVLVLSPDVFNVLKSHPKVLDRIKYTQKAVITEDILAGLLGVDRVLVPWAVVNTAAEGATKDMQFIFSNGALLVYANPTPSILKPSGGYIFVWTGLPGGVAGIRVRDFRIEERKSDRIEAEMAIDCKLVAPDVGVFFSDVI